MDKSQRKQEIATGCMILFLGLLLGIAVTVRAQQLPIRRFDVSDGLAHNIVTSIYQDAKGYLWFGTFEGLSRFDGYHFTNYGTSDGLDHKIINHVMEDRQGRLWVATNGGGVARLLDDPLGDRSIDHASRVTSHQSRIRPKFVSFRVGETIESNKVNRILFDVRGNLWCLTDFGLYRAQVTDNHLKFEAVIVRVSLESRAILEDRQGRLWVGLSTELIEVNQSQVINHGPVGGAGHDLITGIIEDRQGRLLVAGYQGLFEFISPKDSSQRQKWRKLPLKLKTNASIYALLEDSAGTVWLGTITGLVKYQNGQLTEYTTAQGLSVNWVRTLTQDRDGDLWIGTEGGGASKLGGELFVNYTPAEGLPNPVVVGTFEDREERIKATLADTSLVEIASRKVRLSRQLDYPPVSSDTFYIQHETPTTWWWGNYFLNRIQIRHPVLRLRSGRNLALPEFSPFKALPIKLFFYFYEDETGMLWFIKFIKRDGQNINGDGTIYRVDSTKPGPLTFERFPAEFTWTTGPLMISDRAGGLWLGQQEMLGRLWQGKFVRLQPTEGLPETDPRCFFLDSRGWLWIGMRYKGVSMTKEPGVAHPAFVNYSTEQGLSSSAVRSIAEDEFDRIYFGTDRGLDQFDPQTNRWRHYTRKDGLAGDKIAHLYTDRRGQIWVSTFRGLSRFNPRADQTAGHPAPIYFSRVNVAGEDWPLPETGAATISHVELPASRNNLSIEFVGLQFQGEDRLTYEYQLEGVDDDWSAPTKSRVVNYARLSPGRYRFLVRAINQDGVPSAPPAVFEFRMLPPIWRRWWFLMLALFAVGAAAYGFYRYRVSRLLELERVRMRIATDLHDDIGASLSHMAILSEVVKRQIDVSHPGAAQILTEMATMGRELVDAMSDIVWSIDPRREDLGSLIARVRRFASDSLDAASIAWTFETPPELERIKLAPEQRRHVFLIFKEATNNIIRHADCTSAWFSLNIIDHQLMAEIHDNGCGFVALPIQGTSGPDSQGHGLYSMRVRAAELGGQLRIESTPRQGTHLTLTVPLR